MKRIALFICVLAAAAPALPLAAAAAAMIGPGPVGWPPAPVSLSGFWPLGPIISQDYVLMFGPPTMGRPRVFFPPGVCRGSCTVMPMSTDPSAD